MATEPKHTVLVVDDEPDVRDSIGALLEALGYGVAACCNGREALDQLRGGAAVPCVIVLDLMMPVMDGWQFRAEQVRESVLAAIPVIVFSARAAAGGTALGVASVVPKGDIDRLVAAVTAHCPVSVAHRGLAAEDAAATRVAEGSG